MDPATNDAVVTVREIMTRDVVTTTADQPVADAAGMLNEHKISGMPVVNETGALVGMISEYDVISKRGKTVGEIMSRGVISVGEDADAEQVANIISMHGIRRVPVVRAGRLAGIVSRADLVRLSATMQWTCAACGAVERGVRRLEHCPACGSTEVRLERSEEIMHDIDPRSIPVGTTVVAADGTMLGTIHQTHEHYVLVSQPDNPHASLNVPAHAIARLEGQLHLSVNREALSIVDHEESATHRLEEE